MLVASCNLTRCGEFKTCELTSGRPRCVCEPCTLEEQEPSRTQLLLRLLRRYQDPHSNVDYVPCCFHVSVYALNCSFLSEPLCSVKGVTYESVCQFKTLQCHRDVDRDRIANRSACPHSRGERQLLLIDARGATSLHLRRVSDVMSCTL